MKGNEAPNICNDTKPLDILMLVFITTIKLLVEETNNYYNLFLNRQMAINPC
jgi:hypothetical protein